uniref:V-type proton ATPase subunit C n=1 Tax=Glossina palpalis gambiensis TaxID=67801 RepID=A0A1B0BH61_9MUSC
MSEYWLISAPGDKTCQQTFDTMNNLTSKQNNLCNNYKFHIPDLKVGTLDQLVGLSDDLGKLDTYVEQITRKVAAYLGEVLEDQRDKLHENLLANNSAGPSDDRISENHSKLKNQSSGLSNSRSTTTTTCSSYQTVGSCLNNSSCEASEPLTPACSCNRLDENSTDLYVTCACAGNECHIPSLTYTNSVNETTCTHNLSSSTDKINHSLSHSTYAQQTHYLTSKILNNAGTGSPVNAKASSTVPAKTFTYGRNTYSVNNNSASTSTTPLWMLGSKNINKRSSQLYHRQHHHRYFHNFAHFTGLFTNHSHHSNSNETLYCDRQQIDRVKNPEHELEVGKITTDTDNFSSCSSTTIHHTERNSKSNNDIKDINRTLDWWLQRHEAHSPKRSRSSPMSSCCGNSHGRSSPDVDSNEPPSLPTSPHPADLSIYLIRFQWDMAKYPIKQSLRNIADIISKQIGQIDGDLKTKATAYNNLKGNLQNLEKKQTGSLLTRNLADLVKKDHFILDSEYLTTLLVIVPKIHCQEWIANYEKITDMIVPRSSTLITQDNDYCLYNVTLFKKVAEEFKLHAREKKFIVRDFVYNEEELTAGKNEITKLITDKKKQFGPLVRWLKVNFSEAFCALIHVKALRVFVESVLRYGLPVNFQAILIQPHKKSIKRLRECLNQLYGHLDGSSAGAQASGIDNVDIPGLGLGHAEYYPYVSYKINVDMIDSGKM